MKLLPGNFLGTSVRKRFVSGFIFTEYRYAPSTTLRLHSHELAYFSVVLRGAYEEQCSSRRIQQCDTETVLYHPADEMHSDSFSSQGGHVFSLEIPPDCLNKAKDYELPVHERIVIGSTRAQALGRRAYGMFLDTTPASALILEAVAMELLYELPCRRSFAREPLVPGWLERATEILHTEFRRPFSLVSIAERVGTHPVHLARTFKRYRGATMGDYLRHLRVSHALEAIDSGKKSLAEIASEAGFSDQSHFGRVFKAATGMTPQQFRSRKSR